MRDKLIQIINSKRFNYLSELILPTILSILFYVYFKTKYYDSNIEIVNDDLITFSFILLFFLPIILEWIRRNRKKEDKSSYYKYIYIILMLFTFILSIWYVNELIIN